MSEAIKLIDTLISKSEAVQRNNDLFTDASFPKAVLNKMWSYLLDETPFEDALTLTCKAFRNLTYCHPSHASRFHFRLEPQFKLNSAPTNHNKFQIGANISPATKRAIIVPSVTDAIINNPNPTFPFTQLKVFNVAQSCQLKDVIPFFAAFKHSIKFMSWNTCKFLNENMSKTESNKPNTEQKQNDVIKHQFPECTLFSLLTRRRWQTNLNGKFPKLLCFSYTIEWHNHFDLIQQFLDSHASTMVILFLDFNFNLSKNIRDRWQQNSKRLKLRLPPNIEICVLSCLDSETSKFIDIDFGECRHKLKQLVCLRNSIKMCNPMFCDGKGNKQLQFLVINDIDGVHNIKWDALQIGKGVRNQIKTIYVPCTPEFANKISANCIGEFPDLESVKESVESVGARQVLRDLNCEQRRHWLWGLFWFERRGIGMQKLKALETEWKRQESN